VEASLSPNRAINTSQRLHAITEIEGFWKISVDPFEESI
jgi:hypothetical protein